MTVPTRRERLRTATVAEIKQAARRLLVDGGIEAVSLRAIARDMGMTAPAIYRYFPSLEALVVDLAGDLYDELRTAVEAARDSAGPDPAAQLLAMARGFRRWALEHRAEFGLAFGPPVPGMAEFMARCVDENHPGARLGATFIAPLQTLAESGTLRYPPPETVGQGFTEQLGPLRQRVVAADLPAELAYVFLACWTRLYGLVAMEVFNHLDWALTEPVALFDRELAGMVRDLAAPPVHPPVAPTQPG
ncbi:TetR/AcrR family transcriptional regulator [Plantactinospora sp. GCM10030261]|uniref:TetR/AcrR family transcriptional regulator n=1 Tax=Plantactinospora sp. GCM10030261 TaxID=3273420 RepID=UPI00361BA8D9